jgi:hypothetical protein
MLTIIVSPGLPPFGDGDAHLPRPYRPAAVHLAPQALYLHLREPDRSKVTIWHEGMVCSVNWLNIHLTGIQITFIFILILFVDSVNRVYRVQVELTGMGNNQGGGG